MAKPTDKDLKIIVHSLTSQEAIVKRRINAETDDQIKLLLQSQLDDIVSLRSRVSNLELFT